MSKARDELRELRLFLKARGLGVVDAAHVEKIVKCIIFSAISEAKVEQTEFLKHAEQRFGRVDWGSAIRMLQVHPKVSGKP